MLTRTRIAGIAYWTFQAIGTIFTVIAFNIPPSPAMSPIVIFPNLGNFLIVTIGLFLVLNIVLFLWKPLTRMSYKWPLMVAVPVAGLIVLSDILVIGPLV